eukprot:TRINITY_DN338_c0_g2_i1.p1 TRINITY_DN338_c0_g2~~TRINITY_DN338_c0_g2_i1.p1  ORF type:complete len:183 (+),score=8.94 TRINITY_DN338_c0_g2_i1:204-752(+)
MTLLGPQTLTLSTHMNMTKEQSPLRPRRRARRQSTICVLDRTALAAFWNGAESPILTDNELTPNSLSQTFCADMHATSNRTSPRGDPKLRLARRNAICINDPDELAAFRIAIFDIQMRHKWQTVTGRNQPQPERGFECWFPGDASEAAETMSPDTHVRRKLVYAQRRRNVSVDSCYSDGWAT